VFVTWSENPKAPRPALDPGSPAQASLPIGPLPRERSQTRLPDCAARGFAGPSTDPAKLSGTEIPSNENRPTFCGPSWETPYRVPLRSPKFRRTPGAASRVRKISLPAPRTDRPRFRSEELQHCLPAEIGPLVTCRTVFPFRAFWRGRDRRPDHLFTMHTSAESQKRKMG
jgi:hypothetical protein